MCIRANCKLNSWLRSGFASKSYDSMSLKLNITTMCGDPKLVVDAMKSSPRAKNINTIDCVLEGFELFGSTKPKFNVPPCAHCNSHLFDKRNY